MVLRGLDGASLVIPQSEVQEMKSDGMSLMPEGLLSARAKNKFAIFLPIFAVLSPSSVNRQCVSPHPIVNSLTRQTLRAAVCARAVLLHSSAETAAHSVARNSNL